MELIYQHYIFCYDCKALIPPRGIKLTYETFRRRFVDYYRKNMTKRFDPEELANEYDVFDSYHHKPGDFFNSNGLHCLSCGSSNIETKVYEILPVVNLH